MKNGNFIDIKGNLAYLFIYLYSLITLKDYREILDELLLLKKHYGEYDKFNQYCNRWISDCNIVKGQFKEALIYTPNDLNVMINAGIKVTLNEVVKSNFIETLSNNHREYIDFFGEIISEIVSIYNSYELKHSIDTVSLCITVKSNYNYHLFPGAPLIPTKNKNGETDYGIQTDTSIDITSLGILPHYAEITFYEFDSIKFEEFVPNCLKTAIEVTGKRHEFSPSDKYKNNLDKWLNYHPMRARHFTSKEVFGHEESYLYEISKSQQSIDKHYWLSSLVYWYYRNREYNGFLEKAIKYGVEDISLFEVCFKKYKEKDFKGLTSELGELLNSSALSSPEEHFMNSFSDIVKKLATIYEKTKRYKEAVEICEKAINIGIKDYTTKGGFERRISVLRKKL